MIRKLIFKLKAWLVKVKNNLKHTLIGAFLMAFSIILLLSVISYNPIDLVETGGELNFLGSFGAKLADLFLQYFGFATYFIIAVFLRWAFLIVSNESFVFYKRRIFSFTVSIFLLCFLLGSIKYYELTSYNLIGGYLGFLFYGFLVGKPFFIPVYITCLLLFAMLCIYLFELYNTKFISKIRGIFKIRKTKVETAPSITPTKRPSAPVKIIRQDLASKVHASRKYALPPISLLALNNAENNKKNQKNNQNTKNVEKELSKALLDFGIEAKILGSKVGPVITMYEIEPKAGIRAARVIGLSDDIARSLKAKSARISIIPSSSSLAIEIPNGERETVFLREILDSTAFKEADFRIPIALGKSIAGDDIVVDLASMPHLLVAGTTGSGKSVGVNAMVLSILYKLSPDECQFIMIDPKMLELSVYNDIPHLLTPVITDSERAVLALKWLTFEMERRYRKMSAFSVRNIASYNEAILKLKASGAENRDETHPFVDKEELKSLTKMPFIVVIIDEMADLMITAGKAIEGYIQRLAQMARAAGIHVILATQRPSVDVITGVIKANFPTRISFQVSSKIDSRTILGTQGAEGLLGKGDMLYMQAGTKTYRIHAPFVSDEEVNNIVSFLKRNYGGVYDNLKVDIFEELAREGLDGEGGGAEDSEGGVASKGDEEDLYSEAVNIIISENKSSISYLQRRLKIGYNKAANLIERMEEDGILSEADPSTGRRLLLKKSR